MINSFISLLRRPDFVTGATEKSPFRFEENKEFGCPVEYDYTVGNGVARLTVHPSEAPVKYLKLRFRGDLSFVDKVYGDQWFPTSVTELEWRSVKSDRVLPWFCYLRGDGRTACYGVKTGANCFAFWQVDTHGITLFLNLCCGNDGTDLKESLIACEIVEYFSDENESVFRSAQKFATLMCDNPVLPNLPIFGMNDWYWAYGNNDRNGVLRQTDYLMELTEGCVNCPCMVIDDGWQTCRSVEPGTYNGGPWQGNARYGDMELLAYEIRKRNARPGLWFRPLLTKDAGCADAVLSREKNGIVLDPSHPFTLEAVQNEMEKFCSWGYDVIKHDFSVYDCMGVVPLAEHTYRMCADTRKFYDKTKTTAMILKELSRFLQTGAKNADVIACGAMSHLSAGIHPILRVGSDTSGRSYEWTKRQGVNSMMRLPLNDRFYRVDPDCAAFTSKVDEDINLDFLEMCAYSGVATIASVTPYSLSEKGIERIKEIYKIADNGKYKLSIVGYEKTAEPEIFISEDGKIVKNFDWTRPYNGSRIVYSWMD